MCHKHKPLPLLQSTLAYLCHTMTLIACTTLVITMLVMCIDIIARAAGYPFKGVYDIVRIGGVITIACALPMTTAVKGHVAIEYFFRKMNRTAQLIVDSLMRLVMIGAFLIAAYESVGYGNRFLRYRQVSDTIEIPLFWLPWLIAVALVITALVVVFHLLAPGKELIRS